MNRYIAALTIGIGLMAHSSAFAERLMFGEGNEASMEECLVAADAGLELPEEPAAKQIGERRFLIKVDERSGSSWRVYEILMIRGKYMTLTCTYRSSTS